MVREVLIYDLLIKQLVITDNTRELINDLLIKPLVMTDKAFKTCALIRRWRFFLYLSFSGYCATWPPKNCNFRVGFQRPQRWIPQVRRHFKAPGAGWPRHYSTNLFKQLIARQRRLRHTFCGRYEQTVNDVYSRLAQLTTKGVCLGKKRKSQQKRRNKVKNKRKAIQHFSHFVCIVVCLFVGCAGGVEECCV